MEVIRYLPDSRVLVVSDGLLVADYPRAEPTQEKIMAAAITGKDGK